MEKTRRLTRPRRDYIESLIHYYGPQPFVGIQELLALDKFIFSNQTIQRDLEFLCTHARLKKLSNGFYTTKK